MYNSESRKIRFFQGKRGRKFERRNPGQVWPEASPIIFAKKKALNMDSIVHFLGGRHGSRKDF
jgi:hypothetical protein